MAVYTGRTGYIDLNGKLGHMSSWSLSLSTEISEIISYGDDYKEKSPGIKDWSASADGVIDLDPEAKQHDLLEAYEKGELIECAFGLDEKTAFVGKAYIESIDYDSTAESHAEFSVSLSGSLAVKLNLDTPTV